MKIQLLNGGLGNQVFQYMFARYIELATNEPCYLDDSTFWLEQLEHNGFELKRVFPNIKINLLSKEFSDHAWEFLMEKKRAGTGICQQFKDNGMDIFMVAESSDFEFNGNVIKLPPMGMIPNITNTQGNVYFHGYWVGPNYFYNFYDIIKEELTFSELTDPQNIEYMKRIMQGTSVAVHIRRGDFLSYGWDLPDSFYNTSIQKICELLPEAEFFIFSDDLEYCQAHQEELGFHYSKHEVTYIEGNIKGKNYIDMQLMAQCKGMIISKSSFSYLAALLNRDPNKFVINPSQREI